LYREHECFLSTDIRTSRWPRSGAAGAALRPSPIAFCLTGITLILSTTGCATFGRRSADAEAAAAARELSRQGAAAMQIGQWQQAEDLLRQGLDTSPEDAEVRRQLAEALWHRGAANEAMSHIAAAARLEPKNATLAVRAGEMALASGARDAALERAEEAIRVDPQLAGAWALRGRTFRQMNQTERALADLQRALVFDPDSTELLLELALVYRERGEAARCLTTLHHLHDSYPAGQEPQNTLILEGLTLMDLKRSHQAAEVLAAATHRGPANADLLFYLAQAQMAAGQFVEATTSAQGALQVDGSHQPSRELLAQLAARPGAGEPQRR
jgi:tetratricopeptide (TPR) repeat protein